MWRWFYRRYNRVLSYIWGSINSKWEDIDTNWEDMGD